MDGPVSYAEHGVLYSVLAAAVTATRSSFWSFWSRLPEFVRFLVVVAAVFMAGWGARGVFGNFAGLEQEVRTVQEQHEHLNQSRASSDARTDAQLKALLCYVTEDTANRDPHHCRTYLIGYPDLYRLWVGNGSDDPLR